MGENRNVKCLAFIFLFLFLISGEQIFLWAAHSSGWIRHIIWEAPADVNILPGRAWD